ncbi:uncharacterized histidine-rich protein DDB_G0274557-like [Cotesia glomerata]|uniref:uncharacterized histidine-rich protein DDB_G0274557-like n=1 Tax=Cotesia glomerata TaxID=32391 RepID=UPI001D019926|nr:uncharacterized histidine-rich protein DDB_G0274557-like [Cotesia glomerata]
MNHHHHLNHLNHHQHQHPPGRSPALPIRSHQLIDIERIPPHQQHARHQQHPLHHNGLQSGQHQHQQVNPSNYHSQLFGHTTQISTLSNLPGHRTITNIQTQNQNQPQLPNNNFTTHNSATANLPDVNSSSNRSRYPFPFLGFTSWRRY